MVFYTHSPHPAPHLKALPQPYFTFFVSHHSHREPASSPAATILAGSHHPRRQPPSVDRHHPRRSHQPPTTTAVTILSDNHRTLRTVPLAYPELCTQLFEGSTSNGFESWGPSSTLPHPFEEVLDNTSNGLEDVDLTAMGTPTASVNDDSPVQPKKKGVKRKDRESVNSSLIEIKDNINEMAKVFIEKHKGSNDIEACMAKLESMGWDVLDAKYQTAILLFGESADPRKVWLLLNPLACEPWVNNAGAKYGLF
ncbi:hypothetical protein R6Q59_029338 [Mikania micrantha]